MSKIFDCYSPSNMMEISFWKILDYHKSIQIFEIQEIIELLQLLIFKIIIKKVKKTNYLKILDTYLFYLKEVTNDK